MDDGKAVCCSPSPSFFLFLKQVGWFYDTDCAWWVRGRVSVVMPLLVDDALVVQRARCNAQDGLDFIRR